MHRLGLATIKMHTKFEVSSLSHSRDILGGLKWVTWCGHAHFRDGLSYIKPKYQTQIVYNYLQKWKATPNVKILVLSHFLGGLRSNAQGSSMVRWKANCWVPISDNWTFFASSHGSGTMKWNLSKSAFSEGMGRSFVLCRQRSSLLWTPALRPCSGPVHLPRERKGIGRCVRCVLVTCGEGRLSTSE